MSNPAVIKLGRERIGKNVVWLDDNFGESIHIHMDDHRVDLTIKEFQTLYDDLCIALTETLQIPNLDFRKIDPVFLSLWLWPKLNKITDAKIDRVKLSTLYGPFQDKMYKLPESVGVKYLKGVSDENEGFRNSHHIGQTDKERMDNILQSIKENGYPHGNNLIIIYGDENVIRDGQHRASCLYYLYGDIEVPVLRIYFSNFNYEHINDNYNSSIMSLYRKVKRGIYPLYCFITSMCRLFLYYVSRLYTILKNHLKIKKKVIIDTDLFNYYKSK